MWRRAEELAPYTTFRIGGPAERLAEPRTEDEAVEAWRFALRAGIPTRVLGGGSNLLIDDDGFGGAVISMRKMNPRGIVPAAGRVRVSAGVALGWLVKWAARNGRTGLEGFAGIPGLVGGATWMNAGGGGVALGDLVTAVDLVDAEGRRREIPGDAILWSYRNAGLPTGLILGAELALGVDSPEATRRRTREAWERKRASQPLSSKSAGCVFRNPEGDSAGRLIDAAHLKRTRVGGAVVSPKHANFIVNTGTATAGDVRRLIAHVRRTVRRRFTHDLDLEIHCWVAGDQWEGGTNG